MQRFEAQALRRFDSIIAVSRRDADALQRRYQVAEVEVIDTGVDLDFFGFSLPSASLQFEPSGGTVVFVGVMDSPANSDGVTFLMDEIWPIVERHRPQTRAIIVGRNPPRMLLSQRRAATKPQIGNLPALSTSVRPLCRELARFGHSGCASGGGTRDQGVRGDGDRPSRCLNAGWGRGPGHRGWTPLLGRRFGPGFRCCDPAAYSTIRGSVIGWRAP